MGISREIKVRTDPRRTFAVEGGINLEDDNTIRGRKKRSQQPVDINIRNVH